MFILFKLETKKKLHLFYLIVSILLTIATFLYLTFSYFSYDLEVQKRYIRDNEVVQKIYFNDLDKNGLSERFELHYLKDIKRNMLLCYNSDDILMEQFYLDGTVRKEGIHFNDWDNDNNNDLMILHVNNDTLYCDVIDVLGRKYLVKNLYVTVKDERNNSQTWFYNSYPVFDEANNKRYLYLSVATGYGIYSRSVFLIDKAKLKVINKFDSTAPIEKAYLADINFDSKNELVALTKATGNDFTKKGFHDFNSWLLIFKDSLKFFQEPKVINTYPGQSFLYQLETGKNSFMLFLNEINLPRIHASLIKLNSNLEEEKSLIVEGGLLFPVVDENSRRIYTSTREGTITIYDYDLNTVNSLKIKFERPNLVKKISAVDVNNDSLNELLVFVDGEIRVYNQELDLLTIGSSDYLLQEINDSELVTPYNSVSQTALIIPTSSSIWIYSLVNNYVIANLVYLIPFLFIIYFLSFVFSGKIIAALLSYINVFNYFVKISDQGMMLLTNTGKIKKINQSLQKLLLIEEGNYLGKDFRMVLRNNDEVVEHIKNSLKGAQNSEMDLTFRRGDNYFNGIVRVKVFKSFFQYPYAYLVEVIDFSKSLLEDRYKIWSRTSQKIAHDIKTPLSTILLNLKSLQFRIDKENLSNKEVYNEDLTIIQNELDRIKNLTRNFLKFTNSEKPNFTIVDVEEIIRKSLNQFESYFDEHIRLKVDIKDKLQIKADENQLEQLFHILFENAIDAIEGEGFLKISVEEITDITTSRNVCFIEVSDNGKGIPKEIIDKIFEPYFTTKDDGTGMGLAIGKKIAEDHKGTLEFYSHNNLGTTVKLSLPLD